MCKVVKLVDEFNSNTARRAGHEANCRDCSINRKLLSRYGIDRATYNSLLESQDSKCAICASPHTELAPLHVDHCHTDLHVRGLLCSNCNTAIGLLREDLSVIQHAADYLKATQALPA